jgi:DNA-directed RNA polymerase specialized sigma24 family protein
VNHWNILGALPSPRREMIERSYFGGLSHGQITRVLGLAAA